MQDSSFESLNLDDYILDVNDFFSDYIIHEGNFNLTHINTLQKSRRMTTQFIKES